jgi:hypothetical protein
LMDLGMDQVKVAVIQPRIRPWVEGFISTSHNINDVSAFFLPLNEENQFLVLRSFDLFSSLASPTKSLYKLHPIRLFMTFLSSVPLFCSSFLFLYEYIGPSHRFFLILFVLSFAV